MFNYSILFPCCVFVSVLFPLFCAVVFSGRKNEPSSGSPLVRQHEDEHQNPEDMVQTTDTVLESLGFVDVTADLDGKIMCQSWENLGNYMKLYGNPLSMLHKVH